MTSKENSVRLNELGFSKSAPVSDYRYIGQTLYEAGLIEDKKEYDLATPAYDSETLFAWLKEKEESTGYHFVLHVYEMVIEDADFNLLVTISGAGISLTDLLATTIIWILEQEAK